mgnify:CR=1 FL=1
MLGLLGHHSLDVEASHLHVAIAAHGDRLLEVTREHALAIVGDGDGTLLTRSDRLLGVRRYGATQLAMAWLMTNGLLPTLVNVKVVF